MMRKVSEQRRKAKQREWRKKDRPWLEEGNVQKTQHENSEETNRTNAPFSSRESGSVRRRRQVFCCVRFCLYLHSMQCRDRMEDDVLILLDGRGCERRGCHLSFTLNDEVVALPCSNAVSRCCQVRLHSLPNLLLGVELRIWLTCVTALTHNTIANRSARGRIQRLNLVVSNGWI